MGKNLELPPPVKLDLTQINGNAFAIMGAWERAAKNEGWTRAQIDSVLKVATSSNYDHLLMTISRNCKND